MIGIVGSGSFGTALALLFSRQGIPVCLVFRRQDLYEQVFRNRRHPLFPEQTFPSCLMPVYENDEYLKADHIVIATPSFYVKDYVKSLPCSLKKSFILVTKGLCPETFFLEKSIQKYIPNALISIFSGPNFAHEIAAGLPSASVIAHPNIDHLNTCIHDLKSPLLRLYGSRDSVGVQIAGALKNVYAIASGVVWGREMGRNALSALLSRSLAEMRRIGLHLGACSDTFLGLSGIGDLSLTALHLESRNTRFGYAIAHGENLSKLIQKSDSVIEGYKTTETAWKLVKQLGIETPILEAVYRLLYLEEPLDHVVQRLISEQGRIMENA